ncbi:MAG: AAA family ATPase [Nitrospirae bacterium]|nr:AAA family ATPase [Nitrospirota bacterium]
MLRFILKSKHKDGIGKTTADVNLSADLNPLGQCTLPIDLDVQGNASANTK